MRPIQLLPGATIFQTGDPSLAVYVIEDGEVSIRVGDGVEVARLQAGELFGESGVLEARPRAATAIALTPLSLLVTDAAQFIGAFGLNNEGAMALLKLLCRRLRTTTARAAKLDPPAPRLPSPVRLLPNHPRLVEEFAMAPIDIRHLPFQVGNRYGGEATPVDSTHSYCIPARAEANLSAPHFEILRRDRRLGVRDLFSRLGTIVNGTPLSRGSADNFIPLLPGENEVIAGRRDSPFRFNLLVTAA